MYVTHKKQIHIKHKNEKPPSLGVLVTNIWKVYSLFYMQCSMDGYWNLHLFSFKIKRSFDASNGKRLMATGRNWTVWQ